MQFSFSGQSGAAATPTLRPLDAFRGDTCIRIQPHWIPCHVLLSGHTQSPPLVAAPPPRVPSSQIPSRSFVPQWAEGLEKDRYVVCVWKLRVLASSKKDYHQERAPRQITSHKRCRLCPKCLIVSTHVSGVQELSSSNGRTETLQSKWPETSILSVDCFQVSWYWPKIIQQIIPNNEYTWETGVCSKPIWTENDEKLVKWIILY